MDLLNSVTVSKNVEITWDLEEGDHSRVVTKKCRKAMKSRISSYGRQNKVIYKSQPWSTDSRPNSKRYSEMREKVGDTSADGLRNVINKKTDNHEAVKRSDDSSYSTDQNDVNLSPDMVETTKEKNWTEEEILVAKVMMCISKNT